MQGISVPIGKCPRCGKIGKPDVENGPIGNESIGPLGGGIHCCVSMLPLASSQISMPLRKP